MFLKKISGIASRVHVGSSDLEVDGDFTCSLQPATIENTENFVDSKAAPGHIARKYPYPHHRGKEGWEGGGGGHGSHHQVCTCIYYMALSLKDWELPKSRI